jgi:hypothetical protein
MEKHKELVGASIHENSQASCQHFNLLKNQQWGVQAKLGCSQRIA